MFNIDPIRPVNTPSTTIHTYDTGTQRIDNPVAACVAGTPSTGGSITDGTHSYKITFVDKYGFETIPNAKSNVITAGSGNNTVGLTAIPVSGNPDVVARKIYRTVAGDTGAWKLLATISNNTATTYSDIIADASLGADAPTANNTNLINEATAGISVATAGNYTIYPAAYNTGVVVYLAAGIIHWISTVYTITSVAGTVTYWY
jgi:hypothetical protein